MKFQVGDLFFIKDISFAGLVVSIDYDKENIKIAWQSSPKGPRQPPLAKIYTIKDVKYFTSKPSEPSSWQYFPIKETL